LRVLKKLGLIVNPVAGLGGRVGLKGSDGAETLRRARELGAEPQSPARAVQALQAIKMDSPSFMLYTYPGDMGEDEAREAGLNPNVIGEITADATTAEDTKEAAAALADLGVDLLLFAGHSEDANLLVLIHVPANLHGEREPIVNSHGLHTLGRGIYDLDLPAVGI